MLFAILSVFVLALLAPLIHRMTGRLTGWIFAALPAAWALYFGSFLPKILSGQAQFESLVWVKTMGLSLSFYLDGLSLLFFLLIAGIGAFILIYTEGYMAGHSQKGRFFSYLLFFMGSMMGVVLASNLLALFVFWELTSISSYLLIGFNHEEEKSRAGALQALLVTGAGGVALLAGFILVGIAGGSMEMSELISQGDILRQSQLYLPILLLVLAGAFTKSAQFPFHFWLPNAMAAPTPVSAYLHSATMVKAGVYLLARMNPVLGGTPLWQTLLTVFGAVTFLLGVYLALQKTDLKRLLAYSTVASLGLMIFLIGLGSPLAVQASMVFLLGHALYKGALFMVAGGIDHEAGSRDVLKLAGLKKVMPITLLAALLAGFSMAGLPPLFGFIAKELVYEGTLAQPLHAQLLTGVVFLGSLMMVTLALITAWEPFAGAKVKAPGKPHEGPVSLWLGPLVLGILSLLFGIFPAWGPQGLLVRAVSDVLGTGHAFKLVLWHGLNFTLGLSAVTFAGGFLLYALRHPMRRFFGKIEKLSEYGPDRWYEWGLITLKKTASFQTRLLQSGYLRYYLIMVFMTTTGFVGFTLFKKYPFTLPALGNDFYPYEITLMTLIILAALMAAFSRSRLGAMAGLGVVGFGVALVFILYGAPDLAMTQILVETLVVILLVLGFHHMPGFGFRSKKGALVRDAIVALLFGGLMTALVLAATQIHFTPTVWEYYAQNSVVEAHGRNIVNVILVDFRALDTFGEIIVLALAGLGVYSILKLKPKEGGGR